MTARATDYTNDAQQRILKVLFVLFGHVVNGLAPSAIAREIGCSAAVMTRDLDNLSQAGLVEKDELTGLWRLTPRLPQQCFKVLAEVDRADRRLGEIKNRFTRLPGNAVGHSMLPDSFPEIQRRFAQNQDRE